MAAKKRTRRAYNKIPLEVKFQAVDMYMRQHTLAEISRALHISQGSVSKAIKDVRDHYNERYPDMIDRLESYLTQTYLEGIHLTRGRLRSEIDQLPSDRAGYLMGRYADGLARLQALSKHSKRKQVDLEQAVEAQQDKIIEIPVNRKIFNMLDRPERTIALWGGSASGKTYTAIQWAVSQLMVPHPEYGSEGWTCYLCRQCRTNAESDLWDPLMKQLGVFGIADLCTINKAKLTVRYTPEGTPTENMIHVCGIDDPEKVKGSPSVWIIDEANQITEDTYLQITNHTGRAFGTHGKIVLMWNPVSKSSWLYKRFFADHGRDPDFVDLHLTYKDNIWNLSPSYVVQLECNYKGRMRDIYTLGKWGTSEGLIYSEDQWHVEDVPTEVLNRHSYDCIGVDWGTNHPTAVVGITIEDPSPATDMRLVVLVDELYYKAGNQAIANVKDYLLSLNLPPMPIYCDSARPESINDLRSVGLDARKATKHVFDGLTYMQGCYFLITSRSKNVIKEIENYQWDKNPDGVWLEQPLKEWDHAMDAMRYAVYTYHQEISERNIQKNKD